MTLKVLEYDQAADGGFAVWIKGSLRSWVAHHHIDDTWTLATMEGAPAREFMSQDAIDQHIELAKAKEKTAGWNIQYRPTADP